MKLFDKYSELKNKSFLLNLLTNSVYSTMQLENQGLPKKKIEGIVLSVLKEYELKGFKFSAD